MSSVARRGVDEVVALPCALPSLTGVRGVAALWVLAFHGSLFLGVGVPAVSPLVDRGWSGVDLFFVLSGFILMHAHQNDFDSVDGAALRRFAWLRFTRVYPLNFVVLLLIAALLTYDPGVKQSLEWNNMGPFSALTFIRTALLGFLPGSGDWNHPVWSLSAEVVGYAAFPLIARHLSRIGRASSWLAVGSFALLVAIHVGTDEIGLNVMSPSRALPRMFCCFLGGAALYRFRTFAPELAAWAGWAAGGAVVLLIGCSFSRAGAEAMPALYGLLIFSLSYQRGMVDRALSTMVARWFGAISFPLYLVHVIGMFWVASLIDRGTVEAGWLTLVTWVVSCFGLSAVLHWGVELPMHRVARRCLLALRASAAARSQAAVSPASQVSQQALARVRTRAM